MSDKILFVVIGIIGLLINELCMHIGVEFLGINYMIVKVITAAIVMVWNYIARKVTIFSSRKYKETEEPIIMQRSIR
jgi:putative flippase GtrA